MCISGIEPDERKEDIDNITCSSKSFDDYRKKKYISHAQYIPLYIITTKNCVIFIDCIAFYKKIA